MNDDFLKMLGLAKRAGKISVGEDMSKNAVRQGRAKLVITALDASGNTKKSMKNSCGFYKVRYVEAASKDDLGKFTGADSRAVVSVDDDNFAKAILDRLN